MVRSLASVRRALLLLLMLLVLGGGWNGSALVSGAAAQDAPAAALDPIQASRERIEATRSALNSLEGSLSVQGLRGNDLDDLKGRLEPVRRELQQRIDELAPRLASAKVRLQELGPVPAAGAPPEEAAPAAVRAQITGQIAQIEGLVKQYVALVGRANHISDEIAGRRRALFADQVLDRSYSVLDPDLWTAAAAAFKIELRALRYLATDWLAFAAQRHAAWVLWSVGLGSLAVGALVYGAGWILRRRLRSPPPPDGASYGRLRCALEALKIAVLDALIAPLAVLSGYLFLTAFGLVPPRAAEVLQGALVATFILGVGHAVGRAMLAPNEPWRRLPVISDRAAVIGYRYYTWTVLSLAIAAFLNTMHRALFSPVALTVATSAIMALFIGGFVARSLIVLARSASDEDEDSQTDGPSGTLRLLQPLRLVIWLVLGGIIVALAAGYVSLAAFVAARILVVTTVLAGLYLLNALVDAFFAGLRPDTHHAKIVSKTLGLRPNRLDLIGVVIAALLKLALLASAALLVAGSWGTSTADILDTVERATFGIRIGNTTITLWNVVYALLLLLIGIFLARSLQRWISGKLLPRTDLEPSLQTSISTVVGYVGMIIVIAVAMSEVGLNLENVALVAGALSVGIGFGLQSIVSNFVSGLILLAERPIRVGDTINVKGEEGYVRRISVRSTEIETFERSTVIVPNSDLITGMVKNFTHSNTTGRVIVAINTTYDADVDEVRDILVGCACDHPQVLQSPPPRVFLSKLLEGGMGFELRCVVANVDYGLTVKSDLHVSILTRFRKAGVGIACQPWASLARAPSDLVPRPPPPDGSAQGAAEGSAGGSAGIG
ncbi:DUF3772 domain-containing protein [Aquabacter spiritensis]|uniref:Small-conductance mechanosensitive channel n=1 Tax=Aquabacter spiritensis TaxID=933073 RepID=A0A4R3LX96_9HYPH|nr:DUF3772 domain-containing protein [Aquabacter spiritensis]TCT05232.1 small-conductance mechanosensitive channel [Aquabacter spiritensis]